MSVGKSNQEMQDAIQSLIACALECRHCAQACQDEEGAARLDECIRLSQDCADLCALGADLMRRHSVFQSQLGRLCAEACEACAEECSRHPEIDACRECEEACRHGAETCRGLSGALV
jgi:hypothetical protein